MNIKEAQNMIRRIYFERDKQRGIERTLIRTYQELGELTDAIMKKETQSNIEDEVADVFAWVLSIANLTEIDLDFALLKKYDKSCSKCKKVPCECVESP